MGCSNQHNHKGHQPSILCGQKMSSSLNMSSTHWVQPKTHSLKQTPSTSSIHNIHRRKQIKSTHCSGERRSRTVHSWVVEVGVVRLDRWWRGRPDGLELTAKHSESFRLRKSTSPAARLWLWNPSSTSRPRSPIPNVLFLAALGEWVCHCHIRNRFWRQKQFLTFPNPSRLQSHFDHNQDYDHVRTDIDLDISVQNWEIELWSYLSGVPVGRPGAGPPPPTSLDFLARPIEVKAKVKVKIRVKMSRTGSNWLGPYERLIRSTLDFGGKR